MTLSRKIQNYLYLVRLAGLYVLRATGRATLRFGAAYLRGAGALALVYLRGAVYFLVYVVFLGGMIVFSKIIPPGWWVGLVLYHVSYRKTSMFFCFLYHQDNIWMFI